MREYKIEARASVPYAMYIKANSNEEARKIAEKKQRVINAPIWNVQKKPILILTMTVGQ